MQIFAWNPFQSFVVFLGILRVQLDAIEDIMQNYHVPLKFIYEDLFTNCVLAIKPKPWRSNSVLEIVYGGLTLVRDQVIETFKNCKSIAYGILLTLLAHTYLLQSQFTLLHLKPTSLTNLRKQWLVSGACSYAFTDDIAIRVHWYGSVTYCFWKENSNELYNTLKSCINIEYEYPVENCHSIIRGSTNSWDMPEQLSFKAKSIFASKKRQHNFRSYFTPPKSFTFSRKELKSLKFKCAEILVNKIFVPIASEKFPK